MSMQSQSGRNQKLSVAIIACNEADVIAKTIGSVSPIADEVVVLDTGSTDQTMQVAQTAGANVHSTTWYDNFAKARNEALARTTGDWVLWLDAGEVIDVETAQQLRLFVDHDADPDVAYLLMIQVPASPEQFSNERVARVRLMPRRSELEFSGRVRESLLPAVNAAGMRLETLNAVLHRDAREHESKRKVAKARRNARLARLQIEDSGESTELCIVLAEALATLGQIEAAEGQFRQAIHLAERGSTDMLEAYYGLLTCFDGNEAKKEIQVSACLEALDVYPLDAQLLCAMSSYMLSQDRPDLAIRSYTLCLQNGQFDPQTWHLVDIGEVASTCLGLTLQMMKQDDVAEKTFLEGIEKYPDSERLRRHLLNMYIKHGRSDEALAQFDCLPQTTPHREALRSAVRGGLLASQRNWLAAVPYLQTAYRSGCTDPICLRWLSISLMAQSKLSEAREILLKWQQVESTNSEVHAYLEAIDAQLEKSAAKIEPPAKDTVTTDPAVSTPTAPNFSQTREQAPGIRRLRVDARAEEKKPDSASKSVPMPNLGSPTGPRDSTESASNS